MSGRGNKYKSMGASYREGQDDAGGGRGRGRGRVNKYRKQMNGNYIKQGQAGGGDDSNKPQLLEQRAADVLEAQLGWPLFTEGEDRLGWLLNFTTTSFEDKDTGQMLSAVDCYFQCQDGSMFKARVPHAPYFYLQVTDDAERDVEVWLRRKFEGRIRQVEVVMREDLDLKNHLSGLQRKLLKVSFFNVQQLMDVRREVQPTISANSRRSAMASAVAALQAAQMGGDGRPKDVLECIVGMREYDVPYHVRFAIDTDIRAGRWYTVRVKDGVTTVTHRPDLLRWAEPVICAFDIETTKLPLRFPNAAYDQVFMISYMIDRKGFLIVNREVVGGDIADFEYTPKPEYQGPFTVINTPNEAATLRAWFDHMREVKPGIMVTYNGDFFDYPFIEARAAVHGLDMAAELGFKCGQGGGECLSKACVHMDCLHWVNRDSYLPQGQRGLKAVTKAKLGYDPVEVAPEDMVRLAAETPQAMASYSVSDAVATYYLYMTYIHPFIFSLATIIPMPPDEVLRKGSGTLCEQLLMVEAYRANVICPNKHTSQPEVLYKNHLLESETYIGGKVEALQSGVFRADLPTRFKCTAAAYQGLIDHLDRDLGYAIKHDAGWELGDVGNYEEVKKDIREQLEALRDAPNREEVPLIYHLDVAAMYPNIILTNRLQPAAIVNDEDCAACDFNKPGKTCLRQMEWVWRGEHYACSHSEYLQVKRQLMSESHAPAAAGRDADGEGGGPRSWQELGAEEQGKLLKERLKKYTQKVYKRVLDKPVVEARTAGICQRENSFYIDTVRAFRDRRYEYKGLNKKWKGKLDEAKASGNALKTAEAADMVVLYDSLQLAHKCILNSFYGYVMRKGARWYSMEMAGVVTNTGAKIIAQACRLVEQLGKPLELDTDGIWCCLPGSFPENFAFKNEESGKTFKISYPCVMLNVMVAEFNTNDQYQTLVDPVRHIYETSSQMSIEFEVDGPYKAMILPASKEEGKLIKKRYAVFNFDGSLAELKGFEIKRRGELKLIKLFQAEVFEQFLAGGSLQECYGAVAAVANRWLDMLDTQGVDLTDGELMEYISESTTMSKAMEEYGDRKSCAITTAKRLSLFLGDERIKDKGLNCAYVISRRPEGAPTSERAVPCSIFSAEPPVARAWLRKWCGDLGSADTDCVPDVRDILDWGYYKERLGNAIQKIITIPAAMQGVPNPVPRVKHPDWLTKLVRERSSKSQQLKLDTLFQEAAARAAAKKEEQRQAAIAAGELDAAADSSDEEGGDNPVAAGSGDEADKLMRDMEDLIGGAAAQDQAKAAQQQRQHRGRGRVITEEADEAAAVAGGGQAGDAGRDAMQVDQRQQQQAPDRVSDYAAWVKWQKQRWRAGRQEGKRRKLEAAKRSAAADQQAPQVLPTSNVGRFFKQQAAVATHTHWQLLQLAPTSTPGLFRMWVLVDASLYAVPLRVPRQVVVNCSRRCEQQQAGLGALLAQMRACRALLPPGDTPRYVYELEMPEAQWQANTTRLALQLMSAGARAVYQGQLPLRLAASLDLGCVAAVAPAARSRQLGEGFELRELQAKTAAECSYLEGGGPDGLGPALRHISIYHSADDGRGRGCFCVLLPATGRCLVVVLVPNGIAAKEVTPAALDKAWKDALAGMAGSGYMQQEQVQALSSIEFSVEYAREHLVALRHVQRALTAYREAQRGPCVATVQCPGGSSRLQQDMPLLGDFPCVDKPVAVDDAKYPALQWQLRAARRALAAVAASGAWLRDRAALTRYAHVPLAGLGRDALMNIADVLMARRLREAKHVLWAADPALPDLGIEPLPEDDVFLQEDAPSPHVARPGCYRGVVLHLKLHHLAVAAVDQAPQLAEAAGAVTLEGLLGPAAPAFKVLRDLVQSWLADATQNSSMVADSLLKQLYHWVSNPSSVVHQTLLHKALLGLMQRLFVLLLDEMGKLGARVVAADFSSVLIYTGKRNLAAAVGYSRYLLDTLRKRDSLGWLELAPQRWWHALHYADEFNYGGVEASVSAEMWEAAGAGAAGGAAAANEAGAEADEAEIGTPGGPKLSHQWSLVEFLPRALQQHMVLLLAEWMYLPWQAANRAAAAASGATQGGSQAVLDARQAEQVQLDYLQEAVGGRWGDKVMSRVSGIMRHVPAGSSHPDCVFPQLAGSHLTQAELGSPALAFVRLLGHLLALDPGLGLEVGLLRRRLLRLVGCDEFSAAAAWVDPCMSFRLHDIICSQCNDCRELDLCRDPALQAGSWACPCCGAGYDAAGIEARLVAALQSRIRDYALQDLVCKQCKQVTSSRLCSHCPTCGGGLAASISGAAARKRLAVFRNLAGFHKFRLLQELANMALADGQLPQQQQQQQQQRIQGVV
ncbi:hypothetical protein OEZ86_011756 [Tetradesmus obliquus]|nr:hypothetical protein OEZ86_011756 [Tetradesmus obliquus]